MATIRNMLAFIRIRRDTYENWFNNNPILKLGEISYIMSGQDDGKFKVGDGVSPWRNLSINAARFPEDVLTLTDSAATSTLPGTGRIEQLFQQIRNFLKWVKGLFDPVSGHKHNGTDSPKISYSNLLDTYLVEDKITAETNARIAADNEINDRITSVENLGDYAGTFNTYASLPKNKSGFTRLVTVNDWATIRQDENYNNLTTRYVISAINLSGDITWDYDITYSTDISGKQDKLNRTVGGNDNATGTVTDTGGNLSVPVPVTTSAPSASSTQTTSGTRSLRAQIKIIIDNIAYLFSNKINTSEKAAANGVATLDANGTVPATQLPEGGGLLAVATSLVSNIKNTTEGIVYSTSPNLEATLADLYGGKWGIVTNPAPRTLSFTFPAGTKTDVHLSGISAGAGSVVAITFCGGDSTTTVYLDSNIRGNLQSRNGINNGNSISFNSVTLQAGEELSLRITGLMIIRSVATWTSGTATKTEYIYVKF